MSGAVGPQETAKDQNQTCSIGWKDAQWKWQKQSSHSNSTSCFGLSFCNCFLVRLAIRFSFHVHLASVIRPRQSFLPKNLTTDDSRRHQHLPECVWHLFDNRCPAASVARRRYSYFGRPKCSKSLTAARSRPASSCRRKCATPQWWKPKNLWVFCHKSLVASISLWQACAICSCGPKETFSKQKS